MIKHMHNETDGGAEPVSRGLLVGIGELLIEHADAAMQSRTVAIAGDVVNVLFYAGRLGMATRLISGIGDDCYREEILATLESRGTEIDGLDVDPQRTTGRYGITIDGRGERSFTYDRENSAATMRLIGRDDLRLCNDTLPSDKVESPVWIYCSGITLAVFRESARLRSILALLKTRGAQLCFDLNYRSQLWTSQEDAQSVAEVMFGLADLVFVSDDDRRALWDDESPGSLAQRYDIDRLILTRGSGGASLYSRAAGILHRSPRSDCTPIDTTGAGDALCGGVIAGLSSGLSEAAALERGIVLAGRVVQVSGAIDSAFDGSDL